MKQADIRVKICGITQLDQAQAIVELGIMTLGFICVPQSPRYIAPLQLQAIVRGLWEQPIDRIGVFVDATLSEIQQVVSIAGLTGVQLHGHESPEFCRQLRQELPELSLIKAFRVRDPQQLEQTRPYQSIVDSLLLDAYDPKAVDPGQYGGTGHVIAWERLQQFRPDCPWWLAGGITAQNVQQALQWVMPHGIDVSSGVELAPGQKDLQKVAALLATLSVGLV
ncbi:MAG: phosphoribosylanthranilate isomerase [Elainella sp. Prado103]|jgi:phosphoribosylanthranilate isomerase|nr:phosphoribosylanthranilate isomerase [Elainella sp. Prado103]